MLTDCVLALWRRRVLTVLAVVLSVGLAGLTFIGVPPTQRSDAQVLFVPSPKQPGVDGPTNPFLALGGSIAVVASVVQTQVSDDETALALTRDGHKALYSVTPNLAENAGPVLLISTTDRSPSMAQSTMRAVIAAIDQNLRAIQARENIRKDLWVSSVVLTSSPRPVVVRTTQIKISVIAFAGILVLLVGGILVLERRRGRRTSQPSKPATRRSPRSAREVPAASAPPQTQQSRSKVKEAVPASDPREVS